MTTDQTFTKMSKMILDYCRARGRKDISITLGPGKHPVLPPVLMLRVGAVEFRHLSWADLWEEVRQIIKINSIQAAGNS